MLTRYDPFGAMRQLREETNQTFVHTLAANGDGSNVVTKRWTPAVDVKEEDKGFMISADIPGVDPSEIEITMENGILTIRGERKSESTDETGPGFRRVERVHGTFCRRFTLPDMADADAISANGAHGVLEVVIPKKAVVQPKRIPVAT